MYTSVFSDGGMPEYDVGIIGVGNIAETGHIPAYRNHPETEITSIADIDQERRRHIAERYSIPRAYADGQRLLEEGDVDIVSICTPPSEHEEAFVTAVRSGIHAYCEKPFAGDLRAANRMASVAAKAEVLTQVGYVKRYANNYRKLKKFVENGLLGSILDATLHLLVNPPMSSWRYDRSIAGGGVVTENLPHWLDYYMDIFGPNPDVTRANIRCNDTDTVEDFAEISLSFDDMTLDIVSKWVEPGLTHEALRKNTIVGVNGEIEFEEKFLKGNVRGEGIYLKHGVTPSVSLGPLYQAWFGVSEDVFRKPVMDFVDHIVAGKPETVVPASWGAKVTELRADIYERGGF